LSTIAKSTPAPQPAAPARAAAPDAAHAAAPARAASAPAAAPAAAIASTAAAAAPAAPDAAPDFAALIREFQHDFGSARAPGDPDDRPLYGQTLHLASCALDMRFGTFRAHIFQDIIDKHYIIALVHGDLRDAETLYTRIHSSCVTSETLRGIDCDCVQQLEGALEIIAKKGRGILFYLMQEGRGVGCAGKARDRMLVQASLDRLDTFQAYAAMGLRKDHRNYDNLSHICHLLGITAAFIVLTNNPDKLDALRAQGLNIAAAEPIEYEPSPFNLSYLTSKATGGHRLTRPAASDIERAQPPAPVAAFRPRALARARRFIHAASYFLPVKPVDNEILLNAAQFAKTFPDPGALERHLAAPRPLLTGCQPLRADRFLVRIDRPALAAHALAHPDDPLAGLLTTPYWFRTHVYYDIVTSRDFVVLTHGTPGPADAPVIRIHGESLFNRFPLRAAADRDHMKHTIRHIVTYGAGALLLLHDDGRGAGFGAYATARMMTETGQAPSADEACRQLGAGHDNRDHAAAILLLRHHIPGQKIQMILNSPATQMKKNACAAALNAHKFDIEKWIILDAPAAE
jgi:3,4-dihydroxy 2-butanone 4-phosphate synthase/GTP cyclohydrolase II